MVMPSPVRALRSGRATSHRARVSDNLDLQRLLAEVGQDDTIEDVPLEKWTSPTNVCALAVKRIRVDLIHGLAVLLVSPSDGAFAVDV
jgi:hypothetical protein